MTHLRPASSPAQSVTNLQNYLVTLLQPDLDAARAAYSTKVTYVPPYSAYSPIGGRPRTASSSTATSSSSPAGLSSSPPIPDVLLRIVERDSNLVAYPPAAAGLGVGRRPRAPATPATAVAAAPLPGGGQPGGAPGGRHRPAACRGAASLLHPGPGGAAPRGTQRRSAPHRPGRSGAAGGDHLLHRRLAGLLRRRPRTDRGADSRSGGSALRDQRRRARTDWARLYVSNFGDGRIAMIDVPLTPLIGGERFAPRLIGHLGAEAVLPDRHRPPNCVDTPREDPPRRRSWSSPWLCACSQSRHRPADPDERHQLLGGLRDRCSSSPAPGATSSACSISSPARVCRGTSSAPRTRSTRCPCRCSRLRSSWPPPPATAPYGQPLQGDWVFARGAGNSAVSIVGALNCPQQLREFGRVAPRPDSVVTALASRLTVTTGSGAALLHHLRRKRHHALGAPPPQPPP